MKRLFRVIMANGVVVDDVFVYDHTEQKVKIYLLNFAEPAFDLYAQNQLKEVVPDMEQEIATGKFLDNPNIQWLDEIKPAIVTVHYNDGSMGEAMPPLLAFAVDDMEDAEYLKAELYDIAPDCYNFYATQTTNVLSTSEALKKINSLAG